MLGLFHARLIKSADHPARIFYRNILSGCLWRIKRLLASDDPVKQPKDVVFLASIGLDFIV